MESKENKMELQIELHNLTNDKLSAKFHFDLQDNFDQH